MWLEMFRHLKAGTFDETLQLPIEYTGEFMEACFSLRATGDWILTNQAWLEMMMQARQLNREMYFARFSPSIESLKVYLLNGPINNPNQILFLIVDQENRFYGQIGFKKIDSEILEVDNILRVSNSAPGIMTVGLRQSIDRISRLTGIKAFTLKVLSSNEKAIKMYNDLGFKTYAEQHLKEELQSEEFTILEPCPKEESNTSAKMFILKKEISTDETVDLK